MFSKIAAKKITEEERHPMTQKVIDLVLGEIKKPDVVPDVTTSLAQGEEDASIIPKSPEEEDAIMEKQVSSDEDPKDDTQPDQGEEAKDSEKAEEGSKSSDKDADGDTNVVDVEEYDSDLPLTKVVEESIAKRTRSGKVSAPVSAPSNKDKKKSAVKPVKYGHSRCSSKIVTQTEKKKKSLKRKEPLSSDSDYDREKDVPQISESEAEEEDQDVEFNVVHIRASEKKSVGKNKIPQGVPDVPIDNISFHLLESVGRWKFVVNRRLALEKRA
jgi:hypothetical protein